MNYTEYYKSFCISRSKWAAYRKRRKIRRYVLLGFTGVMLLTFAIVLIVRAAALPDYVLPRVTAELGEDFDVYRCLTEEGHSAFFVDGCDTSKRGTFKVTLLVDGKKYTIPMKVIDTVPPHADPQNVYVAADAKVIPEMFVTNVEDADEVRISFRKKPKTSEAGKYEVTVVLRDTSGNESSVTSNLVVIKGKAVFSLTIELGESVPAPSEFTGDSKSRYVTDMSTVTVNQAGKYDLEIEVAGEVIPVALVIRDTVAPNPETRSLVFYQGSAVPDPAEFVTKYIDEPDPDNIIVSYAEFPDMNTPGRNRVHLRVTDASGNTNDAWNYVDILADDEPPVITVLKKEIEILTGDTAIPWSSCVSVNDNSGTWETELIFAESNKKTPGRYTADVVATDQAGNTARVSLNITVHDTQVSEEELNRLVALCIEQRGFLLITDPVERVKAVYEYVKSSITYTGDFDHSDWITAAMIGLTAPKGDCFCYCATAYAIFRYMGYDVILVERSPEYQLLSGNGTHFWLMINIGTSSSPRWYHFDATPQRGDVRFGKPVPSGSYSTQISYLMTDAQIRAYTAWRHDEKHDNVYYYGCDFSELPKSDTVEIVTDLVMDQKYYD